MPYKLSLLDIALREELVQAIKDNKVHGILNPQITSLIKDENHELGRRDNKKNGNKKYVTVDGVKNLKEKVEVDAKLGECFEDISVGAFFDKRK